MSVDLQQNNPLTGIGSMQGMTTGTTMGVGGGVEDAAVDVTYSTKPNNPNMNLGNQTVTTSTNIYPLGVTQNTGYETGVGAATTGNIIGVDGGVTNYGVTDSTNQNNLLVGTPGYSTSSAFNIGQTTTTTTGSVMGVGGGVGDDAVDVTYSTKPDQVAVGAPAYTTSSAFNVGQTTTTTTTTTGGYMGIGGTNITTTGSVMGVGGGIGDDAVDVTYSTKPDQAIVGTGLGQTTQTTTTTTTTTGNIMGVGGGVGDNAVDVTYSTKPDKVLVGATTNQTQVDINNIQMY